jgi:hypothetical protein
LEKELRGDLKELLAMDLRRMPLSFQGLEIYHGILKALFRGKKTIEENVLGD